MLSSAASASQHPDGSTYSAQDSPTLSEAAPTKLPSPQKTLAAQKGKIHISCDMAVLFKAG
jgi:CCR4-NOT transcription complex subunit 3